MAEIFKNKEILILVGEIAVVAGVCFYFSRKNKELSTKVEILTKKFEEQQQLISKHENIIGQLIEASQRQQAIIERLTREFPGGKRPSIAEAAGGRPRRAPEADSGEAGAPLGHIHHRGLDMMEAPGHRRPVIRMGRSEAAPVRAQKLVLPKEPEEESEIEEESESELEEESDLDEELKEELMELEEEIKDEVKKETRGRGIADLKLKKK